MAVTIVVQHFAGNSALIRFSDDEEPFEKATVSDLKKRLSHIWGNPGKIPSYSDNRCTGL